MASFLFFLVESAEMETLSVIRSDEVQPVIRFSIIVPVFEQWQLVPRLLRSLQEQTWMEGDFEVLLIDNGSHCFEAPAELPSWARVLRCETPGSYAARNAGIIAACGSWLLFTDADCMPTTDWLIRMAEAIAIHGNQCLIAGAVQVAAEGDDAPNPYQIYDMVKGIPQAHYVRRGYAATANLCVPKAIIDVIGLFDIKRYSGGDSELCRRALHRGYRLYYAPTALVRHSARDSWQALATKARRVKGGQLTAGSLRRRILYFLRSFAPPLSAVWRFLLERQQPPRFRLIAVAVQMRIWMVDMREALRLGLGLHPERR